MKKVLGIISYLISGFFIGSYMMLDFSRNYSLNTQGRLIILGGACILLYFGGYLLSKHLKIINQ